jgi:hypothetical protein
MPLGESATVHALFKDNSFDKRYGRLRLRGSLGIIPATVAYVYFGSLATNLTTVSMANQSLTRETQLLQWLLQGLGVLSTIAVTFYTAHLANKALKKQF